MIPSSCVRGFRPFHGCWKEAKYFVSTTPQCQYHCPPRTIVTLCESSFPSSFSKRIVPFSLRSFSSQVKPLIENGKSKKKSGGKMILLVAAFGVGAVASLGYYYRKLTKKHLPIANVDTGGNKFLFSEAPPIDRVAKRVNLLWYFTQVLFIWLIICYTIFSSVCQSKWHQQLEFGPVSVWALSIL